MKNKYKMFYMLTPYSQPQYITLNAYSGKQAVYLLRSLFADIGLSLYDYGIVDIIYA